MATPTPAPDVPATAGRILVVDDEFSVRDSLEGWFRLDGYDVATAADAAEALRTLQERAFDVVLLDIRMPGIDGLELQRRIHAIDPTLVVIMITAFASVDTAVQALKEGAFDYVTKPIDPDNLSHLVVRGLEQCRARRAVPGAPAGEATCPPLVAHCEQMRKLVAAARAAGATDAPVLIRGEHGTGRELLARHVHAHSGRRNFPFVPLVCGASDDQHLEGELFGHEKLAFEGARFRRKGKLEMADGGTLLLKEVQEMSPRMQAELLQCLDSREFRRLGGQTPVKVDVRVIATSSADLEQLVASGRFREDLFYRLDVVSLAVPPLRERGDDVTKLAEAFLEREARVADRPFTGFESGALRTLAAHAWPGNVRELENAIEHAVAVGTPPTIHAADLPARCGGGAG
ncbi:MAG: sigma-54-dependent Fis family transcriptional regulator [Planctomycetes bacterium]|nr:sigma-54-dependent Fis family transcriptional regulator [Planctomycetota bacterium]